MTDYSRFIAQAKADYYGAPFRASTHIDGFGETHVVIEMKYSNLIYWLIWVGGGLAEEPDEYDELPFNNLAWAKIKETK